MNIVTRGFFEYIYIFWRNSAMLKICLTWKFQFRIFSFDLKKKEDSRLIAIDLNLKSSVWTKNCNWKHLNCFCFFGLWIVFLCRSIIWISQLKSCWLENTIVIAWLVLKWERFRKTFDDRPRWCVDSEKKVWDCYPRRACNEKKCGNIRFFEIVVLNDSWTENSVVGRVLNLLAIEALNIFH